MRIAIILGTPDLPSAHEVNSRPPAPEIERTDEPQSAVNAEPAWRQIILVPTPEWLSALASLVPSFSKSPRRGRAQERGSI